MKNILSEKDKENESIMSGKTIKDNFYKFKDYIMKYWIPFHLASRQQDVFENLPANINRINKYLLQSINAVGNQFKEKIVLKEVELENRFPDADLKKMEEELHKKLNKLEECF